MSCTFHVEPGITGVSEYPVGEGFSASAAEAVLMAKARMAMVVADFMIWGGITPWFGGIARSRWSNRK
jgi:hypothetical protein